MGDLVASSLDSSRFVPGFQEAWRAITSPIPIVMNLVNMGFRLQACSAGLECCDGPYCQ